MAEAAAATPPSRSFVILVDVSTSVDEGMGEIRDVLAELVAEMRIGERCSVYAFGDQVRRVGALILHDERDRARLLEGIELLQPTDRFTDVTSALDRGMTLLHREAAESQEHVPILITITDGRHNPRTKSSPSFDALRSRFPDFRPGREWFLHYVIMGEVEDPGAEAFVREMGGIISRADAPALLRRALQAMPTPTFGRIMAVAGPCSIQTPGTDERLPAIPRAEIATGQFVETQADGRAVIGFGSGVRIGLDLDTKAEVVAAHWDPLRGEGRLRLALHAGTMELLTAPGALPWDVVVHTRDCAVALEGTRLRIAVQPDGSGTKIGVRQGRVRVRAITAEAAHAIGAGTTEAVDPLLLSTTPSPLSQADADRSRSWDQILGLTAGIPRSGFADAPAIRAGQQTAVATTGVVRTPSPLAEAWEAVSRAWDPPLTVGGPLEELAVELAVAALRNLQVRLGPLETNQDFTKKIVLPLGGLDANLKARVGVRVRGRVPTGVVLNTKVREWGFGGQKLVEVRVRTSPDYPAPPGLEEPVDLAVLIGPDRTLGTFQALLWTRGQDSGGPGSPGHTGGGWGGGRGGPTESTGRGWYYVAALAALLGLGMFLQYYGGLGLDRGLTAQKLGRLLVLRNPVPEALTIEAMQLDGLAPKRRATVLRVGRGAQCDIHLPHKSVKTHHCDLKVWRTRHEVGVAVSPVGNARVEVDGQRIKPGQTADVSDQDRLTVGDFSLLYEDTSARSQVVIHFTSGHHVEGVLHTWDMTAPQFRFAPIDRKEWTDEERVQPIWDVKFAEVEDIFMMSIKQPKKSWWHRPEATATVHAPDRAVEVEFPNGRRVKGELWADYTKDAPRFALFPLDTSHVDYVVVVRNNARRVVRAGEDESATPA